MTLTRSKNLQNPPSRSPPASVVHTLGVVSYLNARPLYESLEQNCRIGLIPAVPADLCAKLLDETCDAALLPVVDYRRNTERLQRVSDACIGCDGETMTVRVYAKRPAENIRRMWVDGDSHTSVILAQIIWRELYRQDLELLPWRPTDPEAGEDVEALLLIGDKVINNAPVGFGFEVDLGAAWKFLTGLPFVFAAWYGSRNRDLSDLARILSEARDKGEADARRIARADAPSHGWPEEAAIQYLCRTLRFRLTPAMHESMDRFFTLAADHGLLP